MPFEFLPQVDDINAVPESFRGLYAKADGADGYSWHPEFAAHMTGLTGALDKERKTGRTLNATLTAWKALGETPEAVTARLDELKTQLEAKGQVNLDKIKADLQAGHKAELDKRDGALSKMERSLHKYLVESAAATAIAEEKGSATLLMPVIRDRVKVVQDGDNYVVRVVDADGDAVGDGKGGFLTVSGLVKQLKADKEFGRAFEASGASGGGTPPGRKPAVPGRESAAMTPTDRIKAGLAARGGKV